MATSPSAPHSSTLAGFADVPAAEQGKLRYDLYKARVDKYKGRYDGMRELEWKILFQMYAGYAAIAVAYEHLRTGNPANPAFVSYMAIAATLVLYIAGRYLTYRIQERLVVFDDVRTKYLAEMHRLLATGVIPEDNLGHLYYWSYHTQLILSTLAFLALSAYEGTWGLMHTLPRTAAAGSAIVALASLRFGWRPKANLL